MKKNVWILNHYATDTFYNKGGRHYWFAKYLKRAGYEPTVFCSNTKHGAPERYIDTKNLWVEQVAEEIDTPFVFVRSSVYKGNGPDRVLNMIGFYRNVQDAAIDYAKSHERPDIIYASSVHPLTLVAGIKLAKRFGVKCICEVRDLWPLSLESYGYLKRMGAVRDAMYRGEHAIYRHADAMVFTMPGGIDYLHDKGWTTDEGGDIDAKRAFYINNGIDLEAFEDDKISYPFMHEALTDNGRAKVVYAGSVRRANHLSYLVEAAGLMREDPVDVVIIGDGDELPALREKAKAMSLSNISFVGRIDKRFIPSALSHATVGTALADPVAQFGVHRYGNSNNKVFDYLASGLPVLVNTCSRYSFINDARCGIEADLPTPESYSAELRRLLGDEERLRCYSENALAEAHVFSFEMLTNKLIEIIESL